MTPGRIVALGALIALVVLVGLAMFAGASAYTITASFDNGGQLVRGNEVQVAGMAVGTVSDIELDSDGRAVVTNAAARTEAYWSESDAVVIASPAGADGSRHSRNPRARYQPAAGR